jgi:hypothetical protein
MKITRRQLAIAAAGAAVSPPALAQTPPPLATPDWDRLAREAHLQSAQTLTKVDLPMLLEPAFRFKA